MLDHSSVSAAELGCALGDAVVERHLAMKKKADPSMILNRDVIF